MPQYKAGDTVYIVITNRQIEEVTIIQKHGSRYTVLLMDGYHRKGICIPQSRIFKTEEEARQSIHPNTNAVPPRPKRRIIEQEGNLFLYGDVEEWD